MIGYGRGGGGGGFGGFPYRSSHQQGQDGRGGGRGRRNNNRGRGSRHSRRDKKNTPVSYYSDLQPLPNQRKLLVGNGGSTIKWLRESTKSSIFIPKKSQPQHPVRVNTSELSNLLHTFLEISCILSQTCEINDTATTYIPCNVKIRSNSNNRQSNNQQTLDMKVNGQLILISEMSAISDQEDCKEQSLLFGGTVDGRSIDDNHPRQRLLAYSISTKLSEENVATIIDNIRFVNASVIDSCQWFYRKRMSRRRGNDETNDQITDNTGVDDVPDQEESVERDSLILIYGTESSSPWLICQAIRDANDKY